MMKRDLIILSLLSLFFFLPGILSPRGFWVADEARYGEIVREMIDNNHWLVLHLNGDFYPDKPPVYFWLCALVSILVGDISPFSCMIVTWFSALGCILATYILGCEFMSSSKAFVGALILMSAVLFTICAEIVRMDMLMTAFIVMSYFVFFRGYKRKSKKYFTLFYLICALAVLTKGPLGFALSFLPVLVFLGGRKEWEVLKQFFANPGPVLFILLTTGWLFAAWMMGYGAFLENVIFKQLIGRSINSWSHKEPVYYYLMLLPVLFLPWTPFFPRALIRNRSPLDGEVKYLLLLWFSIGFLLLSSISGKLMVYVLPLLPPMALFLGNYFHGLLTGEQKLGRIFIIEGCAASLLTFGFIGAVPFIATQLPETNHLNLYVMSFVALPLCALGIVFSFLKMKRVLFANQFIGVALISLVFYQGIIHEVDPMFNAKQIGKDLKGYAEQGYETGTYREMSGILNFYAQQNIRDVDRDGLQEYFQSGSKRLLFLRDKYFHRHKELWGGKVEIIGLYEIGLKKYYLIGIKT